MSVQDRDIGERIVTPGEKLCVIEEFIPFKGTKSSDEGIVYSTIVGTPRFDTKNRTVSVVPLKRIEEFKVGELVLVRVKDIQGGMALTDIVAHNMVSEKYGWRGAIIDDNKILERQIGIKDLVVAKVTLVFQGLINLSIRDADTGVIQAYCDSCGHVLILNREDLRCIKCGRIDKRKIVKDYGNKRRISEWMGVKS